MRLGVVVATEKSDKPLKLEMDFSLPKPLVLVTCLILTFIFFSLLFLTTKFPFSNDEAIYFEMVTRLIHGQGLTSLLFRDFIPQLDQQAFWYPPLYFYFIALLYMIFGETIVVGRMFSVLCGAMVLGLMYLFVRTKLSYSYSVVGVIALLITDPYLQDGSIIARMELLCIVFGLVAVIFHWQWLKKPTFLTNVWTGIFATLSLLTHPTGFIFVLPIGISILFAHYPNVRSRITSWLLFGVPTLIGLATWATTFIGHFDAFLAQNVVQMHRKEYINYFMLRSIRELPLKRVLLLTYLFSNSFYIIRMLEQGLLKKQTNRFLFLLALSTLIFPVLMKEMWYLVYLPLLGSVFLLLNLEWFWLRKIYYAGLVFVLLIAVNLMIYLNSINQIVLKTQTYEEYGQAISDRLPEGEKVLLSIFPDPYFYLHQQRPDLQLRESPNTPNNEPLDPAIYNTILSDVNYLVISMVPNNTLTQYYQENLETVVYQDKSAGHYDLLILKLKPLEERAPVQVRKSMYWQYPKF
ncbi:MAG: hypothetical protein COY81_01415 [Candidatus Pacebacteria bacterium CG_4_10_14_0_8_um_filter_43_12]|nr:MAG: hypothetical protein COY81_01415 [Candidatus Pacebacteria bacterium CG_4_10_14_0_8_um_filter_43_12]